MTPELALDLAYQVLLTCAKVAGPFMLTAIVAGVAINIFQTVTQLRDMSLTFVPKVVVAGLITTLALPWTIQVLMGFFLHIFQLFGQLEI